MSGRALVSGGGHTARRRSKKRLPRRAGIGPAVAAPILLLAVIALGAGAVGWSKRAMFEDAIVVDAVIVPSTVTLEVASPIAGTLVQVVAASGTHVGVGDPLFRVENRAALTEKAAAEAAYYALQARVLRLEAEAAGAAELDLPEELLAVAPEAAAAEMLAFAAGRQAAVEGRRARESEAAEAAAVVDVLRRRIEEAQRNIGLAKEEMKVLKPLVDQGVSPALEILRVRQVIADNESRIARANDELARATATASAADADVSAAERAEGTIAALAATRDELARLDREAPVPASGPTEAVVRAPVAGVVSLAEGRNPGASVAAGGTVFTIAARADAIVAEARLTPAQRRRLAPDMPVWLRVAGLEGVPGDATARAAAMAIDPVPKVGADGRPYFVATVRAPDPASAKSLAVPGLAAKVEVVAGRQTVFAYLSAPLRPYLLAVDWPALPNLQPMALVRRVRAALDH